MKLTVIGLWGAYPKANEASSGYLLEQDGFKLLIDCGSGVLSKMQQFVKPTEIDACITSHYHPDHIADIGVLQHAILVDMYVSGKKKNLPIYGHDLDKQGFQTLTYKEQTTGIAYQIDKVLQIGPFSITFLQTKHPVPCFAMRIEADRKVLVYTADSAYQSSFIDFAMNADLLLSECNFYANMDGTSAGHMNSSDVGKLANKANVKNLILTHLPQYGDLTQLVQDASTYYKGKIELAKMGKEWYI